MQRQTHRPCRENRPSMAAAPVGGLVPPPKTVDPPARWWKWAQECRGQPAPDRFAAKPGWRRILRIRALSKAVSCLYPNSVKTPLPWHCRNQTMGA